MLQPVVLRGAGGHSRQCAEPCWRLTHRLAHPLPTLSLPFCFSYHHFSFNPSVRTPLWLSFISPSLPAYICLSPSILHAPTDSGSQRVWHPPDVQQELFFFLSPLVLLLTLCSYSTFTHSNPDAAERTSHGFNDHCPFVFVCLNMGTGKEIRSDFLQHRQDVKSQESEGQVH